MNGRVAAAAVAFIDDVSCRSRDELCIPVHVHCMCHISGYV